MTQTALFQDVVLPLLLAAADTTFLPAQPWPLDTALAVLDREIPEGSAIARALDRMPQARVTTGQRFTGIRESIRRLVTSGALVPQGEGWHAGYGVSPDFLDGGRSILTTLPLAERAAMRRAAQAFSEASRMLSKNSAASLPSGSARI
jgi:hypothetical protein